MTFLPSLPNRKHWATCPMAGLRHSQTMRPSGVASNMWLAFFPLRPCVFQLQTTVLPFGSRCTPASIAISMSYRSMFGRSSQTMRFPAGLNSTTFPEPVANVLPLGKRTAQTGELSFGNERTTFPSASYSRTAPSAVNGTRY